MTERWIVGVDGSDGAVTALRWATAHAPARGAELTALSAFHVPAVMSLFVAKRGFGVDEIGLAATAGHDIDVAIEQVATPLTVTPEVVEGQPGHVLVDASEHADLLVVGQRGSGDLREHRLGSVSRYCATHGRSSVVVVPGDWQAGPAQRVVVGFDGSDNSAAALRWAIDFARPDDATVTVVAAMDVAPWLGERVARERFGDEVAGQEQELTAAIDAIDPEQRTERSFVLDAPRHALANAARTADLVVVGARGRGVIAAELLGSVSTWLLQDAIVPVAVVPDGHR